MSVVSRFVLCLALSATLAACAIGAFEVPIGSGADKVPADLNRLQVGQSRREDVRAALGGDPVTLFSAPGFELYQMSTGRSSTFIVLLFPMIPIPLSGRELEEGQLRVLAAYDEAGILRSLDWEHAHFSESPLRGQRQESLSEPVIKGFEEPGGPLVVDAYGSAGTATTVDPAELPGPRLVWEADTVTASAQTAFATLGELATGRVTIRDLVSGAIVASTEPSAVSCGPPAHTGWLQADGRRVLLVSADGDLCLWKISSGERAEPFTGSNVEMKPQATRVALAGREPLAATYDATTQTVTIWDTRVGDLRSTLPVGKVVALALDNEGERLAIVNTNEELTVVSTTSGKELAQAKLSGPRPPPLRTVGAAMAPDGRTIAVNRVTHVEIWRLALEGSADALRLEAVLLLPVTASFECLVPVAFSADGSRLAAGCDSAVVWDTTTRRELLRLVPDAEGKIGGAPSWIDEGFALSAEGHAILTTHGVWDVPDPASAPLR